jgi:hypothetical protein
MKNAYITEHPTYQAWVNMRQRCLNSKNPDYKHYGGKGITICIEWDTFSGFFTDMGRKPPRTYLDRIDGNKGYYKENCRWIPQEHNARNLVTNKLTKELADEIRKVYATETITQTALARRYNVNFRTVNYIVNGIRWI